MAAGGTTQGPSFPGEGEWATLQGWGRRVSSLEWGRGRLGLAAIRGGGEGRPETRGSPPAGPTPRFPLPAAAPAGLRPTSTPPAGPRPGAGSEAGGGRPGLCRLPAEPNSSRARPGSALPVLCRRCPADHGLAGDGVQPGGALRLLAAGGEKKPRRGVSGDAVRAEGPSGTDPPRCPAVASFPLSGPRAGPGPLLDEIEDAAAPGDPVSPGAGQGADPLQVQIRRHV